MPFDHEKVVELKFQEIVVCGKGAGAVNNGEFNGVELSRLVRTSLARRTAPSTLSSPAPCSSELKFASCWAVYIIRAFIKLGVSVGLASNINAAAPDTIGAAIEVPLSLIILLVGDILTVVTSAGLSVSKRLFGDSAATILLPGATISGLTMLSKCLTPFSSVRKLRVGPREL